MSRGGRAWRSAARCRRRLPPFIYRLATELGLAGWVNNSSQGVFVEVEGRRACVEEFVPRIEAEKPPRSSVQSLETSWLDAAGYTAFEIRPSSSSGAKTGARPA
ncbi:MAG: acylphosphatase [Terrimicrobiaceae bacterium]